MKKFLTVMLCLTIILSSNLLVSANSVDLDIISKQNVARNYQPNFYFAKGIVTANRLNVREGPGTHFATVGTLTRGTTVYISDYTGDSEWLEIKYNGGYYWVATEYINVLD